MKTYVFDIKTDPAEAFSAVDLLPYSLWLDSSDPNHPQGRYSYICCHPAETIEAKGDKVTVTNADQQTTLYGNPFTILKQRMAAWNTKAAPLPGLPPFQGGAAGFFGYDLARAIETLPDKARENPHMPDMAIGIYDRVLAFDHKLKKSWMIIQAESEKDADNKRAHMSHILRARKVPPSEENPFMRWTPQERASVYKDKIAKVIDYIFAGDIFQANLSQRFEAFVPEEFDRFSHYLAMRDINPAPFATYMNIGGVVIASASPEQFLSVRDNFVRTKPIKGTRPRGKTPKEDLDLQNELLNSAKDRAENIMIVDLLRNDLSKVCEPKSVQLVDLCRLETFAGVHHLVSTIEAKLRETPIDLIKACFPGGSITGAPKIRAMEIIEEMEEHQRGPYCGSMVWIGFDGAMDSNILIRTIVYQGNKATMNAGGGITADSTPEEEYQETLTKADRIFRSFDRSLRKYA